MICLKEDKVIASKDTRYLTAIPNDTTGLEWWSNATTN